MDDRKQLQSHERSALAVIEESPDSSYHGHAITPSPRGGPLLARDVRRSRAPLPEPPHARRRAPLGVSPRVLGAACEGPQCGPAGSHECLVAGHLGGKLGALAAQRRMQRNVGTPGQHLLESPPAILEDHGVVVVTVPVSSLVQQGLRYPVDLTQPRDTQPQIVVFAHAQRDVESADFLEELPSDNDARDGDDGLHLDQTLENPTLDGGPPPRLRTREQLTGLVDHRKGGVTPPAGGGAGRAMLPGRRAFQATRRRRNPGRRCTHRQRLARRHYARRSGCLCGGDAAPLTCGRCASASR